MFRNTLDKQDLSMKSQSEIVIMISSKKILRRINKNRSKNDDENENKMIINMNSRELNNNNNNNNNSQ